MIEARLSPIDIVYLELPAHRRPRNPSNVSKHAVNKVRERMRKGEIDATCERLADGRERWWTTESRYLGSADRSSDRPSLEPPPAQDLRLLNPDEMHELHRSGRAMSKKEAPASSNSRRA